jgi:hypothetical protein
MNAELDSLTERVPGAVSEVTNTLGARSPLPQHQRLLAQRVREPLQALAARFERAYQFQPAVGPAGDAVRFGEQRIQPLAHSTDRGTAPERPAHDKPAGS